MSRIWGMMDVGKRSLMNSQTALQTVGHNIANKSTEGYSRQRVDIQANAPVTSGTLQIGTGARAGTVVRVNNDFIEKQLEKEGNQLGFAQSRAEMLARVEQVYNEQANKGLNQFMGEFFNAFRELSNNPESLAARTLVKETAQFLGQDFKRVHSQLEDIQNDVDFRLTTKVEEINQLTREIAQLNEKIQMVELNARSANDERDRRDHLVKELGAKVNIRYAESKDGAITITAGNTAVLVSGSSHRSLFVSPTPAGEGKREGSLDIMYRNSENGSAVNVTRQLVGGEIGGLLEVRDKTVGGLVQKMDELAYTLATEVNRAHVEGFNRYSQTGTLFFKQPEGPQGAASRLLVNESILADVGKIATAAEGHSPGDNRIANIISSLQYKQVFNDGTSTVDDYYNTVVGQVGIESSRANSAHSSQQDIVKQLSNIRESISGVSLDEETTKMIEYQKSFDASARLIRTADEMMDTVLNLKRY